jgi:predicted secreted hydrolase
MNPNEILGPRSTRRRFLQGGASLALLSLLAACGQPTASSNKAAWPGPFNAATPTPVAPQPIIFPRDEATHQSLTEWWYYTGHLQAEDGSRYGFESVIFQATRNNIPPYFAAHNAITDHGRKQFHYDQRTQQTNANQLGEEVNKGFDFRMGDWRWQGFDGTDRVESTAPGYALNVTMTAVKPPALHEGGYIDYGPAGSTYYYSRTRMTLSGTIDDNGVRKNVTGTAWFDHQWGNFLTVTNGGWDWFSAHLGDGSDFTVYLIRGEGQQFIGSFGTYIAADGKVTAIPQAEIKIDVLGQWKSERTGVTYPSGWRVTLPGYGLDMTWNPIMQDQELDTRQSTTNIYWEGEVAITGTQNGAPLTGEGYVELTGYDQT